MDNISKALLYAKKAHKGQLRKGTNIPYIYHPHSVALILFNEGYSEDVIIAGLLHDTVEDTSVTLEDIKKEFGDYVMELVKGASEPDKSLSWEERKKHTIEYLKTTTLDIKAVACADKLHNLNSIYEDFLSIGDKLWERFNRGKEQQEWYYTELAKSLSEGEFGKTNLCKSYIELVDLMFDK